MLGTLPIVKSKKDIISEFLDLVWGKMYIKESKYTNNHPKL